MSRQPSMAIPRDVLTADEKALLLDCGGPGVVSWARRVRREQAELDRLLKEAAEPEPSNVLPFGRRSSAAWR